MDFFRNIGTGELLFLVLLAILVVGPKRAVDLLQQVGRFVGRIQQEWHAVQRDVMAEVRTLQAQTLDSIQPGLREGLQDLNDGVRDLQQGLAGVAEPANPPPAVDDAPFSVADDGSA